MTKNYYEVLGIKKTDSREDVKRAYLRLSKVHHPDKGGKADDFNELKVAFDVLYNDESRKEYDETGTVKEKQDYKSLAVEALSGLLIETLESDNPRNYDILSMMENHIIGIEKGHNETIANNNKKAAKLNKYVDKIIRKSGGENFLAETIKIKIKTIEQHTERVNDALKLCTEMKLLLEEFLIESNEIEPREGQGFKAKFGQQFLTPEERAQQFFNANRHGFAP